MKRHSATARRPIDENEQNQLSEKKRLKVVHEGDDGQFLIENQLDAGCSSSIKESMECLASVEDNFLNNGAIKKDDHLPNNVCENGSFDPDKSDFKNFSENSNENLFNGSSTNSESDDLCENTQISNLQTIPQEQTSKNLQTVSQEQTIKISSHANNTFVHIDKNVSFSLKQEEPTKESADQISSQIPENESENADLKIRSSEGFMSSDFLSENAVQQSVPQEQSSSSQEFSTHDMTTKEFIEKVLKPQQKPKDFEIENITSSDLEVTQLVGHADVVFSVAVDEDFVISSSADTTIKVWNVHGGKEVSSFAGHSDVVTSIVLLNARHSQKLSTLLKWGQVSRIVVSASLDCHIKLWSLLNGKELLSMYTYNGITSMDYFPCELGMIIGTDGGKLELWDIVSAKVINSVCAHEASVSGIKVEEPYIYTCSGDGTVRVWLLDEKEIQPLYIRRRKEPSSDESFKPSEWKTLDVSGDTVYLGDNSNTLKVLDWRIGHMRMFLNQVEFDGICEAVVVKENVLFSTFFDSSSDTGGINVWKLPEFLYMCTLTGDVQDIYSLAVTQSKDKLRIVSGGQQLLVWDIDFTKPSKKNQETFYVTETDPLGIQLNENASDASRQAEVIRHRLAAVDPSDVNKKSWCNIF